MQTEELSANWKTVVDTIQEGVMIVDPSGTIVSVNQALAEMTGFGAKDLVGRSCGALNCASCRLERAPDGPHWCSLFANGLFTRGQVTHDLQDFQQGEGIAVAAQVQESH